MNKEQLVLVDEAYELYSKEYEKDNSIGLCLLVQQVDGRAAYRKPDREMFISLCMHDLKFSEKWGLKIEERELSLEERVKIFGFEKINTTDTGYYEHSYARFKVDEANIPNKLITIKYNDKKIESYE